MPLNLLLKQKALEIGFDLAGIAPVDVWEDLEFARKWLEQGYGGEMRYLENPKRHNPLLVLPSARSVLCVGLVYNAPLPYSTEIENPSREANQQAIADGINGAHGPRAWISRYAWGRDYHEVMREKLEQLRAAIETLAPGAETRVYVDTGPVVERAFARYSGIGWTGKNTCLINPAKGSWFFLGVILTSLAIEADLPVPDRCGSCRRCLDACPTGALTEPYVMDASRCIAYFNIELKGSIPEQYRTRIGSNMFGCDICQDVCPWNRKQKAEDGRQTNADSSQRCASDIVAAGKGFGRAGAAFTTQTEFQPLQISVSASPENAKGESGRDSGPSAARHFSLFNPALEDLAKLSEEDFHRAFAHSPIRRPKYRGWLRNLCVVMGNSGDKRFVLKLKMLSRLDDPIVREHAEWALNRLAEG